MREETLNPLDLIEASAAFARRFPYETIDYLEFDDYGYIVFRIHSSHKEISYSIKEKKFT